MVAAWVKDGGQAEAQFGLAVSTAGDVNGDGYADVIIGAPYFDNGQDDEGGAWVYHGSNSGLANLAARRYEGNQPDAYLGLAVSTAGDVNGDGYSDVIVGASHYNGGQSQEGRVWVFTAHRRG